MEDNFDELALKAKKVLMDLIKFKIVCYYNMWKADGKKRVCDLGDWTMKFDFSDPAVYKINKIELMRGFEDMYIIKFEWGNKKKDLDNAVEKIVEIMK